jgi:hypothetical protein
MNFSEAIRLGSMATEQGYGGLSVISRTAPCAIGAALLAVGVKCKEPINAYSQIRVQFPLAAHRVCGPKGTRFECVPNEVASHVIALNDFERWPREQIADWVDTIERAQDATAVEPVAVAVEG